LEWPDVFWAQEEGMNQPLIKKNCAIYTRKSNEEGLEMEYNSLDAQYDAAMHTSMPNNHRAGCW
jgi:hypothetical protein